MMRQDPQVRNEAASVLSGLFRNIGETRQAGQAPAALGGLGVELEEFLTMPLDLAVVFMRMSVELTELILQSLEEAGIILTKALTPL